LLSTERMVHIMTRHMPEFFDGEAKAVQTFFPRSMTIDDVTDLVGSAVRQNSSGIRSFLEGTSSISQFTGEAGGNSFTLGMRPNGLIGQFYPRL
jgi:hypothetical protein